MFRQLARTARKAAFSVAKRLEITYIPYDQRTTVARLGNDHFKQELQKELGIEINDGLLQALKKGLCVGLSIAEVTEEKTEKRGVSAHIAYLANVDAQDKQRNRPPFFARKRQEMLFVKNALITSNKLEHVSDNEAILKMNCLPHEAIQIIRQQIQLNQKATFLIGIMSTAKSGLSAHMVRFNVLENGQCSAYDPNWGKITGPSEEVLAKFIQSLDKDHYDAETIHIVGVPRIVEDVQNNVKDSESTTMVSKPI